VKVTVKDRSLEASWLSVVQLAAHAAGYINLDAEPFPGRWVVKATHPTKPPLSASGATLTEACEKFFDRC
jgi:hypothetical protein